MGNSGGKTLDKVRALLMTVLLVSIAFGIGAFYKGNLTHDSKSQRDFVFDGWIYGREDQKIASAALANAGLWDYSWDSGKLAVPSEKKKEFQSVLSNAGAYPKAPSELRVDAVREMNAFESDAKTKIRELNACAMQLERTIEQMGGVEYATVGVRSRRESIGLGMKNVVTASVGVALKEERYLDTDVLSAITVATMHQLGIDEPANISIIDLKEGKSYLGSDNILTNNSDVLLVAEKKSIERYWRDKLLEAFSDIKKLRVSVVADVVCNTEKEVSSEEGIDNKSICSPSRDYSIISSTAFYTPVQEKPSSRVSLCDYSSLSSVSEKINSDSKTNGREYVISDLKSVSSADSSTMKKSVSQNGFALLGNPRKTSSRVSHRHNIMLQASQKPSTTYKRTFQGEDSVFRWTEGSFGENKGRALFIEENSNTDAVSSPFIDEDLKGRHEAFRFTFRPTSAVRSVITEKAVLESSSQFILRSLAVNIAVPRSYLQLVASKDASNSCETFSEKESIGTVLSEIKRFAIDLMRPMCVRWGWTEDDLEGSVVVVAFSDASDLWHAESKKTDETAQETDVKSSEEFVEHSSAYVLPLSGFSFVDDEDCSEPVLPSLSSNHFDDNLLEVSSETVDPLGSSCESNDGDVSNFVDALDSSGMIAEISQTVASDLEKASESENDSDVIYNMFVEEVAPTFQKIVDKLRALITRNLFNGSIVAFVGLVVIIVMFLRRRSGSATLLSASAPKASDKSNRLTVPNQKGFIEGVSRNIDLNDKEFEGEILQSIAVRGDASMNTTVDSFKSNTICGNTFRDLGSSDEDKPSDEYWKKRREALDIIAQYPERAAASLQKWVKNV